MLKVNKQGADLILTQKDLTFLLGMLVAHIAGYMSYSASVLLHSKCSFPAFLPQPDDLGPAES